VTARRIKGYSIVGAGLAITFSSVINDFLGLNPLAGTMVILAFAAVVMASAAVIISEDNGLKTASNDLRFWCGLSWLVGWLGSWSWR
jgi:ABC-type Fe3+ transport system permease subunit